MQMVISINDVKYTLPAGWQDIKLSTFIEYMRDIAPTCPDSLTAAMQQQQAGAEQAAESGDISTIKTLWQQCSKAVQAQVLPYLCKVVAHFTAIPYGLLLGVQQKGVRPLDVFGVYEYLERVFNRMQYDESFKSFKLKKASFYLPKKHLTDATVIEFIEAAQFQKQVEDLRHGVWAALPKLMCVLCRRKGEAYNSNLVEDSSGAPSQRQQFFLKHCDMQTALNVVFFLIAQSAKSLQRSRISSIPQTLAAAIAKTKAAAQHP